MGFEILFFIPPPDHISHTEAHCEVWPEINTEQELHLLHLFRALSDTIPQLQAITSITPGLSVCVQCMVCLLGLERELWPDTGQVL